MTQSDKIIYLILMNQRKGNNSNSIIESIQSNILNGANESNILNIIK